MVQQPNQKKIRKRTTKFITIILTSNFNSILKTLKRQMTQLLKEYSLTQYTDFRKLEFEYSKVKDENQQLRGRVRDVEELYQKAARELQDFKREFGRMETQRQGKTRHEDQEKNSIARQVAQLNELLTSMKGEQTNSIKFNDRASALQGLKQLRSQIEEIGGQFRKVKQSIRQILEEANQKQKIWTEREENFSDEIADLQLDLQSLEKLQSELQLQNERILRENEELSAQIKSYKAIAIDARSQKSPIKTLPNDLDNDFNEEDKDFATDLLGYEKELLSRVFGLVIESFHKDDIQICLKKIYQAYENVTECFREKLQIEYDLSDLECQYQKRKSTGSKQILVQLRKSINNFRKQLFNQKQLLHKREDLLQERIKDLSGQAVHDNRLKNFTIGLQSKLRKHKTVSQENEPMGIGTGTGELSKMGTIEFRHSMETDEIVKQMIQKDRENIQKMLKETRNQFRR